MRLSPFLWLHMHMSFAPFSVSSNYEEKKKRNEDVGKFLLRCSQYTLSPGSQDIAAEDKKEGLSPVAQALTL